MHLLLRLLGGERVVSTELPSGFISEGANLAQEEVSTVILVNSGTAVW